MPPVSRRRFIQSAAAGLAGAGLGLHAAVPLHAAPPALQEAGERPPPPSGAEVLNPRARVPLSFIIDDSTCLVNLAHYCIPQFAEIFPDRYRQDWRKLPREIPDAFVSEFAGWCREHGIKGKYSVIPYPACVGWLDRDLPGWTRKELEASLELLRAQLAPDWDFHPEMVSHTWVIDARTGRPYPERSERFMENWGWSEGKSADELTGYIAYALRVLKNAGIRCEGITTPGGFGIRARPALARAALEACRDVFQVEIPHYFRDSFTDERSVAPRVEYASGLDGPDPRCVVHTIGCTGDWFGGWDGLEPGSADPFISADLERGRLPEVIARGEPAILVCHWPGIYFNGERIGFNILKQVVERLEQAHDNLLWMKLSDIARYWAARELTRIERKERGVAFTAPFACPRFTVRLEAPAGWIPSLAIAGKKLPPLREVKGLLELDSGAWCSAPEGLVVCFDLPKGTGAAIELRAAG